MTVSIRSALLICAALSATSIAPARAGTAPEPVLPAESATLPKVVVPQLLDLAQEPELTQPADEPATPDTESDLSTDSELAAEQPTGTLSEMVAELRSPDAGSHELECLATGIYFESKGEPLAGQLAVGQVIANRAASGRFPSTYCGVLFQRGQFSFVRGGRLPSVNHSNKQWQTAVAIAKIVDQDLKQSSVGKALFFHARYVSPKWRLKRVAAIGNHIFYR